MARTNPIAKRLDALRDQWAEFVRDEQARILVWLARPDEVALINTFVAKESEEDGGEIPDLFFRIEEPFTDGVNYSRAVRASLIEEYRHAQPELAADGFRTDWKCPEPREPGDPLGAMIDACVSFCSHYAGVFERLAFLLSPDSGAQEPAGLERWLHELSRRCGDPRVRFLLIAGHESQLPRRLAAQLPARVRVVAANLDMPAALEELSLQAGHLDRPGGQFRHLFVQMGNAIGRGDLPAAKSLADQAVAITRENNWASLRVAVRFALGSAALSAGRHAEAYEQFRLAEEDARAAEAQGDPASTALRLKTCLAAASALLAGGNFARAAQLYERAAPLAEFIPDVRSLLDCWRMAAYCHEASSASRQAWDCALRGFEVGRGMDEDTRRTSTLAYLGDAMLRLSSSAGSFMTRRDIEGQFSALLGPDWRPAQPASPQRSA